MTEPCKVGPNQWCQTTIITGESYTVYFPPKVSLEVSYICKSAQNPVAVVVVIGSQSLQPLNLQPGETSTETYDIANFTAMTFTNNAALENTPLYIFVQQIIQ